MTLLPGVVGMESGAEIGEKVQGAAGAVHQGRFRAEDGGLSNAGGMGQLAGVPFEVIVDIEGEISRLADPVPVSAAGSG